MFRLAGLPCGAKLVLLMPLCSRSAAEGGQQSLVN